MIDFTTAGCYYLRRILAYMKNSIPENVCNPDLAQIHSCVDKVKKDPKVREVFVTLEEYVEREKAEALEEADVVHQHHQRKI